MVYPFNIEKLDEMTDDDVIAAFETDGYDHDGAVVMCGIVRGRILPPVNFI